MLSQYGGNINERDCGVASFEGFGNLVSLRAVKSCSESQSALLQLRTTAG